MTENSTRSMMSSNYGDGKLDKSKELNESMTIKQTPADSYTKKINNIGGSE